MPATDLLDDPLLRDVPAHEGYKVLGSVVLYQKLGQGGMGAVYRGKHLRLNLDVAIKVMALPPHLPPTEAEGFTRRFIREAQVAASINHTNLVRVSDVNSEGSVYYLVMDYVDGESAGDRLQRKGRLSEEEAVEIALGAAEGLAEAHRQGIVHRDVKPDNIMVDKSGRVRVTDLGLAKAYSGAGESSAPSLVTQTQTAMGTPAYMAPEQFMSARDVGPGADVWSLGVTLYQLLAGEPPWSGESVFILADKVRNSPLPDPRAACPGMSGAACEIIRRALMKEPAERYPDCLEMAKALRGRLGSLRGTESSVLPDARAGTRKSVVLSMTPPAAATMTIIAEAALAGPPARERPRPAPAPGAPAARPLPTQRTVRTALRRSWILPAAAAGGVALLVVVVAAIMIGGRAPERDPLDREAEGFYQRQFVAFEAGRDAEVLRAVRGAGGRYDDTRFGLKIKELGDSAGARIAKAEEERAQKRKAAAEEEEEKKRLAFEAAKRAADEAERAANLEEAVRQLNLALAKREDPELRRRLEAIEARIAKVEQLLAEAAQREKAGDWAGAESRYESALEDATGEDRRLAEARLAEVRKRLAVERAVVEAKGAAADGRWREAWDRIEKARAAGVSDVRLDELEAAARKELAPRESLTGPLGVELALLRGGAFRMGDAGGAGDERPVHRVTLSPFYLGRCEVTAAQFDAYRKSATAAPADLPGPGRLPAVSVSWDEAVAFCKHLSKLDAAGATYRLPTEAEWEFAARGPSVRDAPGRAYPWGNVPPTSERANLAGGADGHAGLSPVGCYEKGATPEGVADLVGNAAEWCADWYGPYSAKAATDPAGARSGTKRVIRGGAFAFDASVWSRASMRVAAPPDQRSGNVGFRVVRELTDVERRFERMVRGEQE